MGQRICQHCNYSKPANFHFVGRAFFWILICWANSCDLFRAWRNDCAKLRVRHHPFPSCCISIRLGNCRRLGYQLALGEYILGLYQLDASQSIGWWYCHPLHPHPNRSVERSPYLPLDISDRRRRHCNSRVYFLTQHIHGRFIWFVSVSKLSSIAKNLIKEEVENNDLNFFFTSLRHQKLFTNVPEQPRSTSIAAY